MFLQNHILSRLSGLLPKYCIKCTWNTHIKPLGTTRREPSNLDSSQRSEAAARNLSVGKNCKISSHTFICEGVTIEDNVFVGHNVTFINDLYPQATTEDGRLQNDEDWICIPTIVKSGASIGSSATLLCGITVGENAIVGAESMVTKDIPPNTIVAGNPAQVLRKIGNKGVRKAFL